MTRILSLGLLAILPWCVTAAGDESKEDAELYTRHVQPLFSDHCYRCHGPEKQESNLRLDTYEGIVAGGVSGALAEPGKPETSLLFIAVSYTNEDLQMPPDSKLSADEIKIVRRWIERGLPHPDAPKQTAPASRPAAEKKISSDFWAFQPPANSPLPAVSDAGFPQTSIDFFILASLEARGIAPSPRADKRTLIRRATFDLIGLPPRPEDVEAFLQDDSADAWLKVVDRLLASPEYGPRWGRHWLDLARYADSNGSDENVAHGNAWRYRDYVISAMNEDRPFDQFVREQIAGDLLPAEHLPDRHERLIATGFLALGAKVLAEVDELKMEMDIVDEQVDTVGRSLLALTLGCARCHDHKFDPIRTADYYALAGIFRSTRSMENFKKVARWHENVIASPDEVRAREAHDQLVAAQKAVIQKVIDEANAALVKEKGSDTPLPKNVEKQYPEATQDHLKKLRDELTRLEKSAPPLPSAMGVTEGTAADTAICIRGSHLTLGAAVPRGVPGVLPDLTSGIPDRQSGRRELAEWLVDRGNPLTARVLVNRVWRWHFGRGLVESTDNFGQLGDRPTNPALLDWLAVWFMDHGWSIKSLHRLIVTSATYQQSSLPGDVLPVPVAGNSVVGNSVVGNPDDAVPAGPAARIERRDHPAGSVDPDNRLLWHFPIRRLEAEVIRDALLSVSGQLERSCGGSLLHVGNREYFFDHTSKDTTRYDSRRRSVYLPVVRNNLYDVFQLFDATDATVPNGDRTSSTVATQALFMLNSPLVLDAARNLSARVVARGHDDSCRLAAVYELCYSRPATAAELRRGLDFLEAFESSLRKRGFDDDASTRESWTALCHVLLAANEFIFVR